ncbi:MAG: NUDIX domain-containing protein [Acidobacteria bacterium]|nr:NUDIX domain-containing protein [Acidobacteriota bacterium]
MKEHAQKRSLDEINWSAWAGVDRATLLFIIKDGKILLIRKKRGLGAGKINGPGGKLDPGETWEEAAIREVEEEILVTPTDVRECGELRFQFVDGYSIHVRVFAAAHFEGAPTETNEAIPLWFDLDAIPYAEMWADDELWFPMMFAGTRFTGRFIFDDDAMLDHAFDGKP